MREEKSYAWTWVPAIMIVLALAVGSYFWLTQQRPRKYTGPPKTITLAAYRGGEGTLAYIAEEQGYFAENALDVTIKDYEAGKLAADALLSGEADISTSADFVLVSNSFDNDDLRVLGTVSTTDTIELVARKDHGIEKISDLKGKKIAVTRKSVGEFFLGTFLTFNGLSIQDIEIVDLKPSAMVQAISNGEIDAGLTWNLYTYDMKSRIGASAISWPAQSGQEFYFLLIAKERWIEDNPGVAERFLDALLKAEQYMKVNNDEAKKFVVRIFNYESSYLDSVWPNYDFVVVLPQALLIVFEDQARWRISNKLTDKTEVPNYLDYIYSDALEALKPEAVTIIR